MSMMMIEAEGLCKRFGATQALDGLDLQAAAGSVLGVLGPNGAGKTTAVRILTTLAVPDKGAARVAGLDVVTHAAEVKRRIGVAAQDATIDETLTGRQNLVMIGRLSGMPRREARARARDLLDRFDLDGAADRMAKTYSGGMRRRLDLAASLVMRPPVLFLDEPTTGLDPTSRVRMWNVIRGLIADGVTLLLTTQYLDEADELADRIVVIDHGRAIANGTAAELKRQTGGARMEVLLAAPHDHATRALAPLVDGEITMDAAGRRLQAPVRARAGLATRIVRALDETGIEVDDIEIRQPSLDDVFFALTGHPAEDAAGAGAATGTDSDQTATDRGQIGNDRNRHETDRELEVTLR
jgi:daunorubicin resistance ABC transporter ATP-binding subunit